MINWIFSFTTEQSDCHHHCHRYNLLQHHYHHKPHHSLLTLCFHRLFINFSMLTWLDFSLKVWICTQASLGQIVFLSLLFFFNILECLLHLTDQKWSKKKIAFIFQLQQNLVNNHNMIPSVKPKNGTVHSIAIMNIIFSNRHSKINWPPLGFIVE